MTGTSERQPCASNVAPQGAAFEIDDLLGACEELVPGRGRGVGHARLAGDARMPGRADDVEEERPAIQFAVDGAFRADRRDDVVDHFLWDVVVPRLDDAGLDEGRHFDERRLADIDVPRALLVLGLGDEALDPEAFDRGDLVVDSRELRVHRWNAGMQVLNPLIERWGQRTVRRKGRLDAGLRRDSNSGEAQTRNQAAGEELAPVDSALGQLAARRFPKKVFLFAASTHFLTSQCFRS